MFYDAHEIWWWRDVDYASVMQNMTRRRNHSPSSPVSPWLIMGSACISEFVFIWCAILGSKSKWQVKIIDPIFTQFQVQIYPWYFDHGVIPPYSTHKHKNLFNCKESTLENVIHTPSKRHSQVQMSNFWVKT